MFHINFSGLMVAKTRLLLILYINLSKIFFADKNVANTFTFSFLVSVSMAAITIVLVVVLVGMAFKMRQVI